MKATRSDGMIRVPAAAARNIKNAAALKLLKEDLFYG
jgi:transcriptional regulator with PAS, ATPase and Fis domain